jgi:transportin-3
MDKIIQALSVEESFEAAVDCISALYRETRDVDECQEAIQQIYPRLMSLQPKIEVAAENEDGEQLRGLTRLFAEAGEAWVIMIARNPSQFRGLVAAVLECCARDKDQEAISVTFLFWYELKQYVTIERYVEARAVMANVFDQLVDVMIKHLEFPFGEGDETDLFNGDREAEEKFREARHGIGDVLKDCCSVIGEREALRKVYAQIQQWLTEWGPQATERGVPHWQELEAPLFALRAMGKVVSLEENTVLPQVIPLIVSIPDHEKLKFQAIMILGRYTEWTAEHPQTIGSQLNYVISGFQHQSQEVVQASAMAIKFLGNDCAKLLAPQVTQLHTFYEAVFDSLSLTNQKEVTDGVASVVAAQPVDKIYATMKLFCDPLLSRLIATASKAQDDAGHKAVAGEFRDFHSSHNGS